MVTVTIQLDTLRCISQVDEPLGDPSSEPYLWVAFFFFDNSTATDSEPGLVKTINMLSGSSGRQVLPENIRAGTVVPIPALLGKTKIVLDLDGLEPVAGVIMVVIEENETSENLIQIGHRVFGEAINDELNAVARGGSVNLTDEQKQAMAARVQSRVTTAIDDNAGPLEFFRRKDRFIGFASESFSGPLLRLLLDKAPGLPYPIQDRVRSERTIALPFPFPPVRAVDEYEISGSISVSAFAPPAPDPCQVQVQALADVNATLEEIDGDLEDLQEQLRLAPPTKKQEIRNKIKARQADRRAAVQQRDQAFAALQQCRAQHPAPSGFSAG